MNVFLNDAECDLERAVQAARRREIPPMPELVVPFPNDAGEQPQLRSAREGRGRRRLLAALSCAAFVAVALFVALHDRPGSTVAIAQVLTNASSAVAVRFEAQFELGGTGDAAGPAAPPARRRLACAIQHGRCRITAAPGLTLVEELATGRGVWQLARPPREGQAAVESDTCAAKILPDERPTTTARHADPLERLRRLRPEEAKFVGGETLDGEEVERWTWASTDPVIWGRANDSHSYGFRDSKYSIDVWVAKSDQLPRRIIVSAPRGEGRLTYDRFVWNRPLAAEQFSLDIPAGYQEVPLVRLRELAASIESTLRP